MSTLYESAYAKINLTLDVLGKRPDGYHDLKSVMQTVSLRDDVTLEVDGGGGWRVVCSREDLPQNEGNLAWKAAEVFCRAAGKFPRGLEIRITKRIPSQAGLGGGSADAAAVLRGLNRYYGEPFDLPALAEISAQVGSDVPFCVMGGTVMAEGRGERLRKLPPMPDCPIVICKPPFSASTPELYRKLDEAVISVRPDHDAMEKALERGGLKALGKCVLNVFDPVVSREHPEMEEIKEIFRQCGALAQQMTGSGSALFGIMESDAAAASACRCLEGRNVRVYTARPV